MKKFETIGDVCLYVWFIHKNEIIRDRKFWRRAGIKVDKNHLLEFNKYELIYELEKLNLGA